MAVIPGSLIRSAIGRLPDARGGLSIRQQVDQVGAQANRLGGLRSRVGASISGAGEREGRGVRQAAGLAVQQQFGDQATGAVTQADTLSNMIKRAKVRGLIGQRGDKAIGNQQLKDRLTQVRSGIARRGQGIRAQVSAENIRAGVNVGVTSARDFASNAIAGDLGSVIGGVSATLLDRFRNKPPDPPPQTKSQTFTPQRVHPGP